LERVEDRLKKALFVVEALEISLQVILTDPVDPVEKLVQKRVFHCGKGAGRPELWMGSPMPSLKTRD